jgi:zinc protease
MRSRDRSRRGGARGTAKAPARISRAKARGASRPKVAAKTRGVLRSLPGPEDILRREMSNGLTFLGRENFSSPSVVVSGYLPAGSIHEARDQAGLADLAASSLMRGTERWSFSEIYEMLESSGASLGIGSAKHAASFQGKALAEDLGLLLDVLAEALIRPAFPEQQVERLKGEKLTALAIRDQDTGARAGMAFEEMAYPGHPYSLPDDGYTETVMRLGIQDLRAFHQAYYGPSGMVIVVVGAVGTAEAADAVGQRLGAWLNPKQTPEPPLPPVGRPEGVQRRDVPVPGKTQCDVVLGSPGPTRFDPEYLPAAVGNSILGRFGLMGRIGDAVRESAGLAYYAYTSIGGGPGPEPWQAIAGVNPAHVERAIELMLREIRKFVTRRVTTEELSENQDHFTGRLPLQLESNEGVAAALINLERFHLGLDYYQRYQALIRAITRDQILHVAQRFLDPDHLAIAVAGPVPGD